MPLMSAPSWAAGPASAPVIPKTFHNPGTPFDGGGGGGGGSTAGSIYFNGGGTGAAASAGTADWISGVIEAPGTSDFTVECWVYLNTQDPNPYQIQAVFGMQQNAFGASGQWGTTGAGMYFRGGTHDYVGILANGTFHTSGSDASYLPPANTWTHVAFIKTGGYSRVFVDGTKRVELADTFNYSSETHLAIGGYYNTQNSTFDGYISNFRYHIGTPPYTISGGNTITPPTSALTAISGTKLLTANNASAIDDDSSENVSLTVNGDAVASHLNPFGGGSGVRGSIYFDGSGDNLSIPGIAMGTSDYTIEMWIYPSAVGTNYHLYDGRGTGPSSSSYSLITLSSSNNLRYYSRAFRITGSTTLSAGTWYHVALERVSGVNTLYLNGVSEGTYDDSNDNLLGPSNSIGRIGCDDNGSANFFNGYISNFRMVVGTAVYNGNFTVPTVPLTAIANTQLLTSRTGTGIIDDASGNGIPITANGDAFASGFSPFQAIGSTNGSYYFSSLNAWGGTNARVITADSNDFNLPNGTDVTVEFWYKIPVTPPTQGNGYLFDLGDGNYGWLAAYAWNQNGKHTLRIGTYYGVIWLPPVGGEVGMTLNQWYHCAITRESGTWKVYLDGVLQGTYTNSSWDFDTYPDRISLGGFHNLTYPNYGVVSYISDFRFVKGLAVYTGNFTPPSGPLTTTGGTYSSTTNVTNPSSAQTLLLTAQNSSGSFVDNSQYSRTLTSHNTVTTEAGVNTGGGGGSSAGSPDVSTASYSTNFDTANETTEPMDLQFNSDGTKLFVICDSTNKIFQYTTSNYSIASASYDSVFKDLSGTFATNINAFIFNGDGTSFYIMGNDQGGTTPDTIYQFDMSTAYDIANASYTKQGTTVGSGTTAVDNTPDKMIFNNDGTKIYITGRSTNQMYQFSLSTAYDISTISYDSVNMSIGVNTNYRAGMQWGHNGRKLYIIDGEGQTPLSLDVYSFTTPYDISTSGFNTSIDISGNALTRPQGLALKPDGTGFIILDGHKTFATAKAFEFTTSAIAGGTPGENTGVTHSFGGGLVLSWTVQDDNVQTSERTLTNATLAASAQPGDVVVVENSTIQAYNSYNNLGWQLRDSGTLLFAIKAVNGNDLTILYAQEMIYRAQSTTTILNRDLKTYFDTASNERGDIPASATAGFSYDFSANGTTASQRWLGGTATLYRMFDSTIKSAWDTSGNSSAYATPMLDVTGDFTPLS